MPRFLRYEDALAWARGRARLSAEDLVRGLDATPAAAQSFLRRMEAEGVIGPAGPDGVHLAIGERRRRWSAEPHPVADRPLADRPLADPWAEVARLRAEAEAAARRAAAAEAQLAGEGPTRARIATLRRMLARELHPDTAAPAADPALQAAYAEVFKRVWPRIERVLDGEPEE
ncbi:hypothetical protein [Paracraurococcus lichenis]|uniref:MarR family transcriptional regulator n=1 Tax=Paracraurococcus lichenis TaxID=3064888 RepID=A0ABT9DZ22_9PROT|nr:hypothetical protein [Paracraurococcus sp. LOR1-02]MDO9709129.1 hypothetical protein [Paracraurococcus sp. LOR1-02]